MPDATRGFVKSLSQDDLTACGIEGMMVNAYHLMLRPGVDFIKKSGSLHRFLGWRGPICSDSGGYQIYSLIHKALNNGSVSDGGVCFRSPLDGARHTLTPELSIGVQFALGVDLMICLDDPRPNDAPKAEISAAVRRTVMWAKRCKDAYLAECRRRHISEKSRPLLIGVVQGGPHLDLRGHCAKELAAIGFDGYGFGARHIDSEGKRLDEVLAETANLVPPSAFRFALGIGSPDDTVFAARLGWDLFDCVVPTREGRHGRLFRWRGAPHSLGNDFYETLTITNERFRSDTAPVDQTCDCSLCTSHSRAYLRYLFCAGDPLALRLASLHNLRFYARLMATLRAEAGQT